MQRSLGMWVGVMAASFLVGGCGSSNSAAGSGATAAAGDNGDPCSFLTKAEMTEITSDVVTFTDSNDATCNYHSDPKDGVQVTVYRTGGAEQMNTRRASAKLLGGMGAAVADKGGAGQDVGGMLKEDKSTPPAIGDEAMWQLNDTLAVRKGDAFVEVSPPIMHDPATHTGYPLVTKDEKRKIAEAVAAKILPKITS